MFGCVVGQRKSEWHLKAGTDKDLLARLLVQINAAVRPVMTIIDGILALEGMGPGLSGRPRELNLLVGSRDTMAADMAVCNVVGLDFQAMQTYTAARQLNWLPEDIHIQGQFHILNDFKFPHIGSMSAGSDLLNSFMRKHVLQKPVCDNQKCKLCGDCWRYCPVKAIDHHIKGIRYDYDACIRCYCCLEICPYGAITIKEPLSGKILERMGAVGN
jgi:Pyruvate/2-oxoacid:ferredoxin oxidoreductase delta subunit